MLAMSESREQLYAVLQRSQYILTPAAVVHGDAREGRHAGERARHRVHTSKGRAHAEAIALAAADPDEPRLVDGDGRVGELLL